MIMIVEKHSAKPWKDDILPFQSFEWPLHFSSIIRSSLRD
jgi:hypothetical protein